MLQFLSDKQQLFVSFSSPGNLIVSLKCTQINCSDTLHHPCLGFGCDLISSHSADYLALVHQVNCDIAKSDCLRVPCGYLRKGAFWVCPEVSDGCRSRRPHEWKQESMKPSKERKMEAKSNTGDKCKWGIICSLRWAQSAVTLPRPAAHSCV